MPDDHATLTDELKRLRKGRGVHATNISERAGPGLRRLCGIRPDDAAATVRARLMTTLRELAGRLPADLGLALLVELGLHEVATQPRLGERLDWLAGRIARDARTARRRADQACDRLAEMAGALPDEPASSEGWYTRHFSALVLLDGEAPEVTETRTVVATRDGITELDTDFSLPRHPDHAGPGREVGVTLLYGGRLVRRLRQSESYWAFSVALPDTLHAGQRHEFALRLRMPPGQPVRNYYAVIPHRRCDEVEMRLRFHPDRMPARLWRLAGAPVRVVDDAQPSGELLAPDAAGEIHQTFSRPRMGFAYGVQWRGREAGT